MTTQMLTSELPISSSGSQSALQRVSGTVEAKLEDTSLQSLQKAKLVYQAAQQEKFLHLQAEADTLLRQLQLLKQQRMESADQEVVTKGFADV